MHNCLPDPAIGALFGRESERDPNIGRIDMGVAFIELGLVRIVEFRGHDTDDAKVLPPSWRDLPRTAGSAPKNCCQTEWLMTTTPAFSGRSSSASIARPSSGATSSVEKNSASTAAPLKDNPGSIELEFLLHELRHCGEGMALRASCRRSRRYRGLQTSGGSSARFRFVVVT